MYFLDRGYVRTLRHLYGYTPLVKNSLNHYVNKFLSSSRVQLSQKHISALLARTMYFSVRGGSCQALSYANYYIISNIG